MLKVNCNKISYKFGAKVNVRVKKGFSKIYEALLSESISTFFKNSFRLFQSLIVDMTTQF